jgi:hypothetical protein
MIVDPTQTGQTTLAATHVAGRATAANASLFSTALAKASTKATSSSDTSTSTSDSANASTKAPKSEKTEDVKGHSYSEVIAGPRNGMFVNHSGNARDGQAFARVRRDGREFHIYGTGKNRVIVEVKHKDKTPEPTPEPTDNTTNDSTGTSGSSSSGSTPTAPATDTTGAPAS